MDHDQSNKIDPYEVLLKRHRVGSEVSGTVIAREEPKYSDGIVTGRATLQTETPYLALLPYLFLVDEPSSFSPVIVPKIGARVDAVVFNFVDGTLYLSAKPKDLLSETIAKWREYYTYIESLRIDSTIRGTVKHSRPFGLFVDIGGPFIGLIDIGHSRISGGVRLPYDRAKWPREGDEITCTIAYFRLRNQQIGLGWLP